jgi:hypothetical protein
MGRQGSLTIFPAPPTMPCMGTFYDFGFPPVESHEGYGARRLPDGKLTGTWTHETRAFTAYVAACDCGWHGEREHPPTDEGDEAAIAEWQERHMRPLLPSLARKAARRAAPRIVSSFESEATAGLGSKEASAIRSLVTVASLNALVDQAEARLGDLIAEARRAGATWSAIGDALGTSKQAAQQRFGSAEAKALAPRR